MQNKLCEAHNVQPIINNFNIVYIFTTELTFEPLQGSI